MTSNPERHPDMDAQVQVGSLVQIAPTAKVTRSLLMLFAVVTEIRPSGVEAFVPLPHEDAYVHLGLDDFWYIGEPKWKIPSLGFPAA